MKQPSNYDGTSKATHVKNKKKQTKRVCLLITFRYFFMDAQYLCKYKKLL